MTVPVAWGTYEPAVRYVYAHAQPPIPPFAFSLAYYAVAAATLVLLAAIEKPASSSLLESKEAARKVGSSSDLANLPSADRLIEQVSPLEVQPAPPTLATDGSKRGAMVTVAGGIELGSYLFVGNAMQLLGLQTVSSDRAAFLLQLTTVFVPLLQAVVARNVEAVSLHVWCACVVALAGVFVMGLDGGGIDPSLLGVTTFGEGLVDLTRAFSTSLEVTATSDDLLVVGAAVAYTLHCVRLEKYAKQAPSAVQLAAAKASTEALLTLATVLVFVSYYFASLGDSSSQAASAAAVAPAGDNILLKFALDSGRGLVDYASALRNGLGSSLEPTEAPNALASLWPVAAATLWSGWVTIAYTIYAQSYGQRRVRPATANLIYTVQPICTAIVAWMVLGETMGPAGYAGGTLIGAAVLLVVAAPTA
jgi:drug/metabolite transporter (DMT)-like permease